MPLQVTKWRRKESASLNDLGLAALAVCRAQRARDEVEDAKYYWGNPSEIWIIIDGAEEMVLNKNQTPESLAAMYDLSDLATQIETAFLADARGGFETYEAAGRS